MSNTNEPKSFDYRSAGVNIDAGQELVDRIKPACQSTRRPEVVTKIGGFSGLCRIPTGYEKPLLVSATDGVGTKVKLAIDHQSYRGIGIDLVAMCVNDLVVCGAEPLFFLDYYATGALRLERAATVIESIAAGCKQANCALIGGETAEMPGMYQGADFDLAGFCVGVVEEDQMITGESIAPGDKIIALASSGIHSNGYSLVRKIIDTLEINTETTEIDGRPLIEALMEPTKIYVKSLLGLNKTVNIQGLAHITGGGLTENIPRILPDTTAVTLNRDSWKLSALYQWLQASGNLDWSELARTFNCGVGMIAIVKPDQAETAIQYLNSQGETAWLLGEVTARDPQRPIVNFA